MKVLFLDQTGNIGGAEKSLAAIAERYEKQCLICLFEDGPYKEMLVERSIPVLIVNNKPLTIRRESNVFEVVANAFQVVPLIFEVAKISKDYDIVHANTPKALVVGSLASLISGRPLTYHLRDILVPEHFSWINRRVIVTLANLFVKKIIAVSKAAGDAFVAAGGKRELIQVIYNGFDVGKYQGHDAAGQTLRESLGIDNRFVIGHFSRLAEWKGQHVLIKAMAHCPDNMLALIVGDALFGESDYAQSLKDSVVELGLQDKVMFLGFRKDVPQLMAACDLIAHTSIAPEPSSRVLVESTLGAKPLVATADGGSVETIEDGVTGWLVNPNDSEALADKLNELFQKEEYRNQIAQQAQKIISERFDINKTWQSVDSLLHHIVEESNASAHR